MTTRNSNSRFDLAPQVNVERSTFDMSTNIKTSFDVGRLIPFVCYEILPGDTVKIQTSKVMRLQTLITPVMDNLYLDTYYFFVPHRLVWDHWENFIGGTKDGDAWTDYTEYTLPVTYPPVGEGWDVGTIADYLGVPTGVYSTNGDPAEFGINSLPFRSYAKIILDWFWDENLQDPPVITTSDTYTAGTNSDDQNPASFEKGGMPFIAAKFHDYFTSALPKPQKGPDVPFLDGFAPVLPMTTGSGYLPANKPSSSGYLMTHYSKSAPPHASVSSNAILGNNNSGNMQLGDVDGISTLSNSSTVYADNLFADLANSIQRGTGFSTTSINTLRQAFQIQRMLERDARGGSARYIEVLKAHFGVTSPDARLQRAEYLGGNRVPFNIEQVLQTSSSDETTPQGNVAGWSQTNDTHYDVEKSFVEHGFIIGLMCARYDHSYQQGLEKMWARWTRYDYYWPVLAHLGEKPVWKHELFWNGTNHVYNWSMSYEQNPVQVFGYQEAWSEYRYKPNYVTGQMRSQYAQSLDFWHFADYYEESPTLSGEWIREDSSNIDRTLAVTSTVANQIFGDIFLKVNMTRPMPLYSIPGLIDHF